MKYTFITLFIILLSTAVWAQLPYYPLTSMAEEFTSTSCTNCALANAGLDVVEAQGTPGNFFTVKYYTQSGPAYTFAGIDERIAYYQVLGVPSVIFNGKDKIDGGIGMEDGITYSNTLTPYKFGTSPVKMEILSFNPATLEIRVKVTMYDSTYVMTDAPINFLLLQNSVGETLKNVTRDMKTDIVNVTTAGNSVEFTKIFTPSVTVNPDSLWVAAFIQTGDHTILQSVSSKPLPDYYSRVIIPFKQVLHCDLNVQYQSPHFQVWNFDNPDDFTIKLVVDNAPDLWFFGFCSPTACFGSGVTVPFNLGSDSYTWFTLDVSAYVSGIAQLHFEITQAHIADPVIIPFTFMTSDAVTDNIVPPIMESTMSNYPNPFGEQTNISYRVSSKNTDKITLDIYNIKGQIVKRYSQLSVNNGEGSLVWNGTGYDGKSLPSGIYFSRLNGVSGSKIHKMVIFR